MNQFRVNAKHLFLTYPKANFNHEELYRRLCEKLPINYCIVATELHQDGEPHNHVYIKCDKKTDIRDSRLLDFDGHHPNIQSCQSHIRTINYVKKSGNYSEFGERKNDNIYDLAKTLPYEEFMQHCLEKKIPYGYACDAIRRAASIDPTITEETELKGTIDQRLQWYGFDELNDNKSYVLIGPSGCGKTTWALKHAPKPSLFVSHIDDLKHLKPHIHKSIIFDDMDFKQWPKTSQIHLVDRFLPRSIHVRYGTVKIPAGIAKIFTCNEYPFEVHEAITRRVNKIDLY